MIRQLKVTTTDINLISNDQRASLILSMKEIIKPSMFLCKPKDWKNNWIISSLNLLKIDKIDKIVNKDLWYRNLCWGNGNKKYSKLLIHKSKKPRDTILYREQIFLNLLCSPDLKNEYFNHDLYNSFHILISIK